MFDIVQTLSCCRGVKASILADIKTWHINSLEGGYLIHYQVNTFPSWATPRLRTTPLLGFSKACLSQKAHLPLTAFCSDLLLGETHTHLCTKHTDILTKTWLNCCESCPGSHFVCHRVTYSRTNKSTSWSQISGNKAAWKETKWPTRCCVK